MEARHENVGHARKVVDFFGTYRNDLRQSRTHRQIVFSLAVRLAAKTSDTTPDVLVDIVLAHAFPPNYPLSLYVTNNQ